MASPELYINFNGRPTKSKVVWSILVDVNHVKATVIKLREINWLYKHIHEDCVDEAVNEVVEVVKNTTSTMLEKATKEDIADMLGCVRRGAPTEETLHTLEKRVIKVSVLKLSVSFRRKANFLCVCFPPEKSASS